MLSYSRPFDRGYLVNWGLEIEIWKHVFGSEHLNIHPSGQSLVVTEAPFTPESLRQDMNEVIFEEFGFERYSRKSSSLFSAYEFSHTAPAETCFPKCCTIIDSGFSFTHITPIINGIYQPAACKRINVGGKLLTNYLKETIRLSRSVFYFYYVSLCNIIIIFLYSYRQWNMMDEFKLIDQVKEELCYVSLDFVREMNVVTENNAPIAPGTTLARLEKKSRRVNTIKKYFVLPDFQNINRGFVKPEGVALQKHEQVLTMETERFSVPEILFNPSDIGIEQAGIPEAVCQSLENLSQVEAALVFQNIILTGGNVKFPQFKERLTESIRPFLPDDIEVTVHLSDDPINMAWKGASRFAQTTIANGTFSAFSVSKAEYEEYGHEICNKRFAEPF